VEKDAHVAQGKPKAKEVAQPPTPSKTERKKRLKPRGSSRSKRGMTKPTPIQDGTEKACTVIFQTHACAMKGGIVS
jgi:hypothetical protein